MAPDLSADVVGGLQEGACEAVGGLLLVNSVSGATEAVSELMRHRHASAFQVVRAIDDDRGDRQLASGAVHKAGQA